MSPITNGCCSVSHVAVDGHSLREGEVCGSPVGRKGVVCVDGEACGERAAEHASGICRPTFVFLFFGVIDFPYSAVNDCRGRAFQEDGVDFMVVEGGVFQGLVRRRVRVRGVPFFGRVFRASVVMFLRRIGVAMFDASSLTQYVKRPITHANEGSCHVEGPSVVVRGVVGRATDGCSTRSPTLRRRPYEFVGFRILRLGLPGFVFVALFACPILLLFITCVLWGRAGGTRRLTGVTGVWAGPYFFTSVCMALN